jgi:hypothetical protein
VVDALITVAVNALMVVLLAEPSARMVVNHAHLLAAMNVVLAVPVVVMQCQEYRMIARVKIIVLLQHARLTVQ